MSISADHFCLTTSGFPSLTVVCFLIAVKHSIATIAAAAKLPLCCNYEYTITLSNNSLSTKRE